MDTYSHIFKNALDALNKIPVLLADILSADSRSLKNAFNSAAAVLKNRASSNNAKEYALKHMISLDFSLYRHILSAA
ncbi:MAG: hypothetical protein ABIH89_10060 [Elusimicrobiota bacterium]